MQERAGRARFGVVETDLPDTADTPAAPPRVLGPDATDMLAEIPLFATLSPAGTSARSRGWRPRSAMRRGACLCAPDVSASAFYVILSGSARVETPHGGVELQMGDFFGEMAVIDGEPRSATVVAISEVWVMAISRTKFLKVLEAEPKIALAVMATLTRRLRAAQQAGAR